VQEQSLVEQLESFGLSNTEAEIYLYLISRQPKTVLEIARDLNLPRTSVYDNTVKLAEKGLIQRIATFKSQRIKAYPLSILQASLDKQKTHLTELQDKLVTLDASLAQGLLTPAGTEVRYFYGTQGFRQMMWNALKAKEHIGYSQFGRVAVVGEAFIQKHLDEILERGISDRVITNPEMVKQHVIDGTENINIHDARRNYQDIRVIKRDKLYVSGDITIYNDVFAAAYWKQGEVVGIEIENPELAKTQRSIFELLWELAAPAADYSPKPPRN